MKVLLIVILLFKLSKANSSAKTIEPSTFYMITLPKALILESEHNIFVQITDSPAVLRIDSQDPVSGLKVSGEPFILRQSISRVRYQIPFAKLPSPNIQLTFYIDVCEQHLCSQSNNGQKGMYLTKSIRIPVLRDNFLIFGETNKPIYRPGELVRFRFLAVHPTKLDVKTMSPRYEIISNSVSNTDSNYTLRKMTADSNVIPVAFNDIFLEDSNLLRIAQWRNVSWEKAMYLNYRLSEDAKLGSWKIVAKINSQTETLSFKVDKYVLPKFTVDLKPPTNLIISDKNITFSVCAKYSTGRPMRATIRSRLCVKPANIAEDTRPCIRIVDVFPGDVICKTFTSDTDILKLRSTNYKYWNTRVVMEVEVEEDGTGETVEINNIGVRLERHAFKILLDSLDYYKPGLPYYGLIKTKKHNGEPHPFARVEVSVVALSYYSKWGFSQQYETDENGQLTFFMPPFPSGQDYSLKIREMREEETKRPYFLRLVPSIFTKTVTAWASIYKSYLQISPISNIDFENAACTKKLTVTIQSNIPLKNQHVYVDILSRGHLVSMQDISPESEDAVETCQPRDDELGHYTCTEVYGSQILIQCLPGWSGHNCLTPICSEPCQNGICTEPDRCLCKEGWSGKDCSICVPRRGCLNGNCIIGNDCQCLRGWRGYLCDKKRTITHSFVSDFNFNNKLFDNLKMQKDSSISSPQRYKREDPMMSWSPFLTEIQEKLIFSKQITINLPNTVTSRLHVVLYITQQSDSSTEIVAESFDIDNFKTCDDGSTAPQRKFKFDRKSAEPGSEVYLEIEPGTRKNKCSLRINDASLQTFDTSGGVDILKLMEKLQGVNKKIRDMSKHELFNRMALKNCKKSAVNATKGMKIYFSNKFDSNKAFNYAGIFALTNAQLLGETCDEFPNMLENVLYIDPTYTETSDLDMEILMREYSINKGELLSHMRNFMPESWKFEYLENPEKAMLLRVPDSITTWKADIYCITEKGLWVAPSTYLTVAAPFYVDIVLPYSIKYREIIDIPVRLFNYLSECYQISVEIVLPQEYRTVKLIGKRRINVCICDHETKIMTFQVIPTSIGELDIIVQADAVRSSFCSNRGRRSTKVDSSDAISRGIRVEPQGISKEFSVADLICLKNESVNIIKQVKLPSSTFPGSERGYLIYSGDVMGSTLANLDQLVNLPSGCGEQNMARLVPSIYVLDYFEALDLDRPNIVKKAMGFIKIGYKEQLKYRRDDGSFTAFGEKDSAGSTWLTAFVLNSFTSAKKYIDIDDNILSTALDFLKTRQTDDGCFEERGNTFSSTMKGGVDRKDSSNLLLTAYVLTALSNDSSAMNQRALNCLKYNLNPDSQILNKMSNYSLALTTYAFSIHEPWGLLTETLVSKLIVRSLIFNGVELWSDNPHHFRKDIMEDYKNSEIAASNSLDVETTAYAYLALENFQPLVNLMRSIRWLTSQKNSIGGFHSTQDTVMGLKALSNFARRLDLTTKTDIKVSIQAGTFTKQDEIREADRLLTRQIKIEDESPKEITWNLTGNGCIYIQSVVLYNLIEPTLGNSPFSLSYRVTQYRKTCSQASLSICFSHHDENKSTGMILVTVFMVSGWEVSGPIDKTSEDIKLVEINKGNVSVYYDAIEANDKSVRCFKMNLKQIARVKNAKESLIKIIDYYEPDRVAQKFYSLDSCIPKRQLVSKLLKPDQLSCPMCWLQPGDWDELKHLFKAMICPKSRSAVVYGSNNKRNLRTYFMPLQNRFYEWSSEFVPDRCGCVNSSSPTDPLLIITTKRWKLYPGDVVNPDGDFLITRPEFMYNILREKVPARCQLVSPLRRMVDRLVQLESNQPYNSYLGEENCPICIQHFTSSVISLVKYMICESTLISAKLNNGTDWTLSLASTPISRHKTDILLDPACECDIDGISQKTERDLWITAPREEIAAVDLNQHPLEPNSAFLITHEGTYRAFAKYCEKPIRNAFVHSNDWSEFLG